MTFVIPWLLSAALGSASVSQASIEQRFADAQRIFDAAKEALARPVADDVAARKQFYEAASSFAALANDGVRSVNLYVNAGNAFHFAGDNPRALLWYLRANRISNNAETRKGLVTLRQACRAEPWPPEQGSVARALLFWHYDLKRPLKQWMVLAIYPLGCLLVVAALLRRDRRRVWLRVGAALMIGGAALGVSDLVAERWDDGSWAVVLERGRGYAGDGESYSVVVDELRPGQEVRVLETRAAWVRTQLPSGTTCWVRAGICERV